MTYIIHYPEDNGKKFDQFRYPAGEEQVRFKKEELSHLLDAVEIVVIARLMGSTDVIGLALLTDAIDSVTEGVKRTLVLPYLPYSRADRRFLEGDCFGLKTFGRLIDSLAYERVITVDVHSNKAKKYISNLLTLSPLSFISDVYASLPKGTAILLPDEGAKRYGIEHVFKKVYYASKKRNPVTGAFLGFEVPEEAKKEENLLIVDDICDGGGTFVGLAQELPERVNKYLYVTHGIFSQGTFKLNLFFKKIFTTDSIGPQNENESLSVAPIQGYINKAVLPLEEVWKSACQSS